MGAMEEGSSFGKANCVGMSPCVPFSLPCLP